MALKTACGTNRASMTAAKSQNQPSPASSDDKSAIWRFPQQQRLRESQERSETQRLERACRRHRQR